MKKILWMNYIWATYLSIALVYVAIKKGYIISPYVLANESIAYVVGNLLGQLLPIFVLVISALAIKGVSSISFKFAIIMNNIMVFYLLFSLIVSAKLAVPAYAILVLAYLPFFINIFGLAKKKRISS